MSVRSLWKRQCDSTKNRPGRLYDWVAGGCVKKLELLVKQIRRSKRDETIPLRQTVIDCRIDGPEVITAGLNASPQDSHKLAILIPVRSRQGGAQSGRVEEIEP